MTSNIPTNQNKIIELESIRGIAALLIVAFHIPKWHQSMQVNIITNSYLMVDLFFVLSGFVICQNYYENINNIREMIRFQFLRFWRLYPIHLTFLLIFFIFEIAKYIAVTYLNINYPYSTPFEKNSIAAFTKNIFLLSSLIPNEELTFNYPSWSISAEFFTYFLFSLIILLCNKFKRGVFLTISLLCILLLQLGLSFGLSSLLRCMAGFFIGCLTAITIKNSNMLISSKFPLLVFLSLMLFLNFKTTNDWDQVIYFLTAIFIFSIIQSPDSLLKKALRTKPLAFLGAISYSIYMSHAAVIWIANQFLRLIHKPNELGAINSSTPQLSGLQASLGCLIIFFVVILVSTLTYKFIEKPFREKSRQYRF